VTAGVRALAWIFQRGSRLQGGGESRPGAVTLREARRLFIGG
jgi:hypothetical protein